MRLFLQHHMTRMNKQNYNRSLCFILLSNWEWAFAIAIDASFIVGKLEWKQRFANESIITWSVITPVQTSHESRIAPGGLTQQWILLHKSTRHLFCCVTLVLSHRWRFASDKGNPVLRASHYESRSKRLTQWWFVARQINASSLCFCLYILYI